jgi:FAD/FMN-containing dehydrogenase
MMNVSSWGRLSCEAHDVLALDDPARVAQQIAQSARPGLPRGLGRSYGDVGLNPGHVLWDLTGLDHLLGFDADTGRLTCEAGVSLREIQRLMVPRGWSLPVTPGTLHVTVGGAIANDVHGKNHHRRGCFGDHVLRFTLARTDGAVVECAAQENGGWFAATVGGMGLTGAIVEATLQLQPVAGPWVLAETLPYASLEEFFQLADASESEWEHTVSWIDCGFARGRGIFLRANPVAGEGRIEPRIRERSIPWTPPLSLVNGLTLPALNAAYFHLQKNKAGRRIEHASSFLYPLDALQGWNRIYGPHGFYQYQCVIPPAARRDAVGALLREISRSREGSFLAVLKTFGDRESRGMIGFARPGVTLALDFANRGEATRALFEKLDAIVREARGRIYPAKDARMSRSMFEEGYPRLAEFMPYRDPGISSAMSRRLMGN